jgi:hypothetical protein
MVVFRSRVASFMGGSPAKPLIPAVDAAQRPTLRRGASSDAVSKAQGLLNLPVTGVFDADMEAALRRFQSGRNLAADGILGPETWKILEPAANAPAAAPVANAVSGAAPTRAAAPVPGALPPAETPDHPVTLDGLNAAGPDGTRFAHRSGPGFMTIVETKLSDWLAGAEASGVRATDSQKRVVRAMSVNEGGMEAVNSYDDNFLSFGVFQWTAGGGDAVGELPALLSRFKQEDAAAYADCFGNAGLDPVVHENAATGFFTLDGTELRTAAAKAPLRTMSWAYRFWRAGHHPALRACEAELAVSRIGLFYDSEVAGRPIRQWMTSELGVALLLDEHVNRPSHVHTTLGTALQAVAGALPPDPADWETADEHRLILAYIDARRPTSMTDSDKRAKTIMAFVPKNALSDARKSYAETAAGA